MVSQITDNSTVFFDSLFGIKQRKHRSSAFLALCGGIHQSSTEFSRKGPVMRKTFSYHGVIIITFPLQSKHSLWYHEPVRTLALLPYRCLNYTGWFLISLIELSGPSGTICHRITLLLIAISTKNNNYMYQVLPMVCGLNLSTLVNTLLTIPAEHIEAETKWPTFSRRHFERDFLEWKCMNIDWNFTEVCS